MQKKHAGFSKILGVALCMIVVVLGLSNAGVLGKAVRTSVGDLVQRQEGIRILVGDLVQRQERIWTSVGDLVQQQLPGTEVRAAWQRAQQANAYRFTADMTQTTIPLASVSTIGQRSRQEKLHIEGQSTPREQTMHLTVWTEGGSVLDPASGLEMRVEGDQAYARYANQAWEEIPNITGMFANQGDTLSFLVAARNIARVESEEELWSDGQEDFSQRSPISRYTFEIDGAAYAAYARDQLEQALDAKGELPVGMRLAPPETYANMEGHGELWLDAAGLPRRQVIYLSHPPEPGADHRIDSAITIDYAGFDLSDSRTVARTQPRFPITAARTILPPLGFSLLIAAGCMFLIIRWRSRWVYGSVALGVIASMVLTPLLQSVKAVEFSTQQTARAQAQREEQQRAVETQQWQAQLASSDWDAHADPLAQAEAQSPMLSSASFADDAMMLTTAGYTITDPNDTTDSDGDGLTDYIEERLGTSVRHADSDGDTITDTLEVRGFAWPVGSGVMWYADPNEIDTNNDGLDDAREWRKDANGDGLPDDTDGDGTPDLFDADNDNDGVPDRQDLSPFSHVPNLGRQTPSTFNLSGFTPQRYIYAEFQVRPSDPEYLWYAFNVLDWPSDKRGQIQDADNKTFYDVAVDKANTPLNPNAHGDLRVVPMLEIEVDTCYGAAAMPEDLMRVYGVSVRKLDKAGQKLAYYIPLHLVNDEHGDRVAFRGKMIYYPTAATWGMNHTVRMVWALQTLVDQCKSYTTKVGNEEKEHPTCQQYSAYNQTQIIHTYYEENWTLTGMNIREDHGMDVALIYEDPAVDNDINYDGVVTGLAFGLEKAFLTGRDTTPRNQKRDLVVKTGGDTTLAGRFDRDSNGSVPDTDRWNLHNILQVETRTYAHQDVGMAQVSMTETQHILSTQFKPRWAATQPITPVVLIAREERFRATNLDGLGTLRSPNLSFSMAGKNFPLLTVTGVTLTPYAYDGTTWTVADAERYWDTLAQRYAGQYAEPGDDADTVRGKLTFALLYLLALRNGLTQVVAHGDTLITAPPSVPDDASMAGTIAKFTFGTAGRIGVVYIINQLLIGMEAKKSLWKFLGSWAASSGKSLNAYQKGNFSLIVDAFKYFTKSWKNFGIVMGSIALIVVIGVLVGAIIGTVVGVLYGTGHAKAATQVLGVIGAIAIGGLIAVLLVIVPIISIVKVAKDMGHLGRILLSGPEILGTSVKSNAISMVINIAVAWGVFMLQLAIIGPRLTWGIVANLTARAMAETFIAIMIFILSLTVIGTLIVGLYTLVDTVMSILCMTGVVSGDEWCTSFTEELTDFFAERFYYSKPEPDVTHPDLIQVKHPNLSLQRPEEGFVAGNVLVASIEIRTNLHSQPKGYPSIQLAHMGAYDIAESNVRHTLAQTEEVLPIDVQHYKIDAFAARFWQSALFTPPAYFVELRPDNKWRVHLYRYDYPTLKFDLSAGVNQSFPVYLNTSLAAVGSTDSYILGASRVSTFTYQHSTSWGDKLVYDVLPATFGEFYHLQGAGNGGFRLDWDESFTSLKDADGDGLLSPAHEGIDPNDRTWDADGDSLSDAYELQLRAQGYGVSPMQRDTDGDGLDDAAEVLHATDPANADSDGDGLSDKEEITGWTITLAGQTFHVTSNPIAADADADGITDLAERRLAASGYHPRVWNPNPYSVFVSTDDADNILAAGQRFTYRTEVRNTLPNSAWNTGVLQVARAERLGGGYHTQEIGLNSTAQSGSYAKIDTPFTVPATASSGPAPLNSTVYAKLGSSAQSWRLSHTTNQWPHIGVYPPRLTQIAPQPALGFGDTYAVAGLEYENLAQVARPGDITLYPTLGTAIGVDSDDGYERKGPSAADVACADNGNCLVVWEDSYFQNCTTLSLDHFSVQSQADEWGSWSEYSFQVNNREIFVTPWNVAGPGFSSALNKKVHICGAATVKIYEYDIGLDPWDLVANFTVNATAPGSVSRAFHHTENKVTLNWTVHENNASRLLGKVVQAVPDPDHRGHVLYKTVHEQFDLDTNYSGPSYVKSHPTVASDGQDFVVAWEFQYMGFSEYYRHTQIHARRVDNNGDLGAITYRVDDTQPWNKKYTDEHDTRPDLVWAGDHYFAAWQNGARAIWGAQLNRDGALVGTATRISPHFLYGGTPPVYRQPSVAYAPSRDTALVAYREANGNTIRARTLPQAKPTSGGDAIVGYGDAPQAAYDPFVHTWLIGWTANGQFHYLPWGGQSASVQSVTWPARGSGSAAGVDLRCPAPQQAPVFHANFEQPFPFLMVGDQSDYDNHFTCTPPACPTPLVPGVPNDPRGDFGFYFDGVDDHVSIQHAASLSLESFTLSAWFHWDRFGTDAINFLVGKSPGNMEIHTGGDGKVNRLRVIPAGYPQSHVDIDAGIQTGWNHMAVTYNGDTVNVYVNGVLRATRSGITGANDLRADTAPFIIGRRGDGSYPFKGSIDDVRLYPMVLNADAIRVLYGHAEPYTCLASAPSDDAIQTANIKMRLAAHSEGTIIQHDSITLTVDADTPNATFTSLRDGQAIRTVETVGETAGSSVVGDRANHTLIIGGEAHDATSSVTYVEISVDGGAWQRVQGAETWSYALQLATEGEHMLRVRAVDVVGHVGTPQQITVHVDNTPPQVTTDLAQQPRGTSRSGADGRWATSLTGTLNDALSGAVRVEVDLTGPTADPPGGGWQAATLNGTAWTLNYAFPVHVADVGGIYSVTLRAEDHAGNRSGDLFAGTLHVDGRAPTATLTIAPSPTDAALWLPLNEAAGATTFADASGHNHSGICSGANCPTAAVGGVDQTALRFDGVDDYVSVAHATGLNPTQFTLSTWFYWDTADATSINFITAKGSENFEIHTGGGAGASGLRVIPAGYPETHVDVPGVLRSDWNHVAVTYDGSTVQVYVNGDLRGTRSDIIGANDLSTDTAPFTIGRRGDGTYPFKGHIDEVRLYNRILIPEEILALARETLPLQVRQPLLIQGAAGDTGPGATGLQNVALAWTPLRLAEMQEHAHLVFPLDDPVGSLAFSDHNGHLAKCADAATCPTVVGGYIGNALRFDGIDDVVRASGLGSTSDYDARDNLTLAAWVNWSGATGKPQIILYNGNTAINGYGLYINALGWLEILNGNVGFATSGTVLGITLPVDTWQHIAAVRERGVWKLYLNGTAVPLRANPAPYTPSGRMTIGANTAGQEVFQGIIDEVYISGQALSAERVRELYAWQGAAWQAATTDPAAGTWNTLMPELDGLYRLDLRATDANNNQALIPGVWRGQVETRAPRLFATVKTIPGFLFFTPTTWEYTFSAEDHWLDISTFKSPCPAGTTPDITYDTSQWWRTQYPNTARAHRIKITCNTKDKLSENLTVSACDIYGRCSQQSLAQLGVTARQHKVAQRDPLLFSDILTPTNGSVITNTIPLSVTGLVYAQDALRALTVTHNTAAFYTKDWAQGVTTATLWTQPWMLNEGEHVFHTALSDWQGRVTSDTITVTVDTQPPTLSLTTDVITSAHETLPDVYALRGLVTDTGKIARVQGRINNGAWQDAQIIGTNYLHEWSLPWVSGGLVDGSTYTLTAHATDVAGRAAMITRTVIVDVAPPAAVTPTLSYEDLAGAAHTVAANQTLTDATGALTLTWTASSDASGLRNYQVQWQAGTLNGNDLYSETFTLAEPRVATYWATGPTGSADAVVVTATLIAEDLYGNRREHVIGPVYVDSPYTPDYLHDLAYRGWQTTDCAQIGVSRAVSVTASAGAALNQQQVLYASWDTEALRLTWQGADWDVDGDLFLYLDTAPGGTQSVYNPYTRTITNTTLYLPGMQRQRAQALRAAAVTDPSLMDKRRMRLLGGGVRAAEPRAVTAAEPMEADYLIWAQDNTTAWLLRWDGSTWVTETVLGAPQYAGPTEVAVQRTLSISCPVQTTDFYLPFTHLNISDPENTALKLLALASEEHALRLWAAMPANNPLNSPRVGATQVTTQTFALTHYYEWDALGPWMCPAQDQWVDPELTFTLDVEPDGVRYTFKDLYWLWEVLFAEDAGDTLSEGFDFMDIHYPAVADGQTITYTLTYANAGTGTAYSVTLDLAAWDALRLEGATRSDDPDGINWDSLILELAAIAPGEKGTLTFKGYVDIPSTLNEIGDCMAYYDDADLCYSLLDWTSMDVLIYDALTDPGDGDLPFEWLWVDHIVDYSGPEMWIESPLDVIRPGSNVIQGWVYDESDVPSITLEIEDEYGGMETINCNDPTPDDDAWMCIWDAVGVQDGDYLTIMAYATDSFGHTSDDDQADWTIVMVDAIAPTVDVDAQVVQALSQSMLNAPLDLKGSAFDDWGIAGVDVCHVVDDEEACEAVEVQTVIDESAAYSYDDVPGDPMPIGATTGCDEGTEIVRTFTVADNFTVGDVNLGFNADHAYRGDLVVTLMSPAGTEVLVIFDAMETYGDADNFDVLLNDDAVDPLSVTGDDDTAAPYYDRQARPYEPLFFFAGEASAGQWTLTICDFYPEEDDGAYNRSRLFLTPEDALTEASWAWTYPLDPQGEVGDAQPYTLTVYARDLAGNRSSAFPLTYRVDTVAPVLTATSAPGSVVGAIPIIGGEVRDGDAVRDVTVRVYPPIDEMRRNPQVQLGMAALNGTTWQYTLHPNHAGRHYVWLDAVDTSGNLASTGPYIMDVALTPGYVQFADPDSTIRYTHTLINNTDALADFKVTADSSRTWQYTLHLSATHGTVQQPSVSLAPGMTATIAIDLRIPTDVLSDVVDYTVITVTDTSGVVAIVTDTTTVNLVPAFSFEPDRSASNVSPGRVITYMHTLTNQGNGLTRIALTHHSSADWFVEYTTPVYVEYVATETVMITLTVPLSVSTTMVDTTVITATAGSVVRTIQDITTVGEPVQPIPAVYLPLVMRN